MKTLNIFLFIIFSALIIFPKILFAQEAPPTAPKVEVLEGVITDIVDEREVKVMGKKQLYQKLEVLITKGRLKDKKITVEMGTISTSSTIVYKRGDEVFVSSTKSLDGKEIFYISDYVRRAPLGILFSIFVLLAILIGGLRGAYSLIGLAFSFFIIFSFLLPQISKGQDPIFVAIVSSCFIIPVTFYLSHGLNKKTTAAIVGTVISLALVGILSGVFVAFGHLTGFTSEESTFLEVAKQGTINLKGLLLAGIIIGALGILDDITISQAAIVNQLKDATKSISFSELYSRSMEIGKDHIASMVNTLILIYTGASLPLLLLFINNSQPFSQVINYEIVAEEIIRTLIGSIGLILAVPITTLIACFFFNRK